jgi:hypothetical protein
VVVITMGAAGRGRPDPRGGSGPTHQCGTGRTVAEALHDAARLEARLRALGHDVGPASVLIRTAGLSIAVTVQAARSSSAVVAAQSLIDGLAGEAGVALGRPSEVSVGPGWRPSSR